MSVSQKWMPSHFSKYILIGKEFENKKSETKNNCWLKTYKQVDWKIRENIIKTFTVTKHTHEYQ